MPRTADVLPAAQWRAWLMERERRYAFEDAPRAALAAELGVWDRTIYRWLHESNGSVERRAVEDALHHAGLHVWDVFDERQAPVEFPATVMDRFWRFVPERPADGCWLWWGGMDGRNKRTPMFSITSHPTHKLPAARFVWMITHGDPGERYVWRTCGSQRCVRADHLCLKQPRVKMSRGLWGETNPNATLTDRQVRDLRILYSRGATVRQLANHYGLTYQGVRYIVRGEYRLAAGGPVRRQPEAVAA